MRTQLIDNRFSQALLSKVKYSGHHVDTGWAVGKAAQKKAVVAFVGGNGF